ncbi:DUF3419 family protein [Spirulina sp. 06S082]|uniref:DUF3419 family protein n=1 Tax=Spirulina sp. 06S082 TaxID=3110248 RepID=UPI002B20E89C|nr:DUF3419 family protein [Spirulina sp. 06S082]MEA5470775.1 DUF3419 family protein [Spirulina sp. 06S082]
MTSQFADFTQIRYAQCWEDADILLKALNINHNSCCLSIASAGDNTLAMLSRSPQKAIAIDFNPAQIACLELRVAAYRSLTHPQLLKLMGSISAMAVERLQLYHRCRPHLNPATRHFWDRRDRAIARGIGSIGKFERYLALFRRYILPLIHPSDRLAQLLQPKSRADREIFYQQHWNNWRWRFLFRLFFSRFLSGWLGRDRSFYRYVEQDISQYLLEKTEQALTQLDPAENPYLQWIVTGEHPTALPYALRPENFEAIRANLHRLEWHCMAIEDFLNHQPKNCINCYNLSNIFEYISQEKYENLLTRIVNRSPSGSRLAYWNLFVQRSHCDRLSHRLHPLSHLANKLHLKDKAFFYQSFIVEEVI